MWKGRDELNCKSSPLPLLKEDVLELDFQLNRYGEVIEKESVHRDKF